jgi:protein-S-isoprenylcysteine O-methyltransferase Ste14
MNRFFALYFAARGWTLALLFIALTWSRAAAARPDAPLRWEMLAVLAAGMLLRAWAGAHLGPHGNGSRAEAPALATTGPYAFSRNPLYLSNLAIGTGLVFFANSLSDEWTLAFIVFLLLHHVALARWEEKHLREAWPAEFEAYAGVTPRWFSLKPPATAENITQTKDWSAVRARQGRNLLYVALCVLILWAASQVR